METHCVDRRPRIAPGPGGIVPASPKGRHRTPGRKGLKDIILKESDEPVNDLIDDPGNRFANRFADRRPQLG